MKKEVRERERRKLSVMVAISLYRGNLHKVPDVPRRWLMPTPKISLKDFRQLLHRRSKTFNNLRSNAAVASTSNPNPSAVIPQELINGRRGLEETKKAEIKSDGGEDKLGQDADKSEGTDLNLVERIGGVVSDTDNPSVPLDGHGKLKEAKVEPITNPNLESKEKRKMEIEEKLIVLNEKKHKLVQVLKQILQAEEELKRRNNTQGITNRPPVPPPLQVDTTNGSPVGNTERAETDDASNHNLNSRHLLRTSSASPTSESLQRRPPFSVVPHPARTSLASPLRFTPPAGNQNHPVNIAGGVTISGTSYITSSPSPAASGGTSVLRDSRLMSPWN